MIATPRPRRQRERGSALTEFVLVAPLFVVLMFWAEFFVDLGVVRMKLDEAARFAMWEMTAQRPETEVQTELNQRFADLASPMQINHDRPAGVRSFRDVQITTNIRSRDPAPFSGSIASPQLPGVLGVVADIFVGLLNQTVSGMLGRAGLPQEGRTGGDVTFTVTNSLFPGGSALGIFFDSGINTQITMRARGTPMLVNTWKAWPGKYWRQPAQQNVNTDVYDTYPRVNSGQPSAVERTVASVIGGQGTSGGIAYMGFAGHSVVGAVNSVFGFLGFPRLMETRTWADRQGPIAILPMAQPAYSWAPGYGTPTQRLGAQFHAGTDYLRPPGTRHFEHSREFDVDRSRYTVPGRINTPEWRNRGGYSRMPAAMFNSPFRNPYLQMLNCRDVYYMGSRRSQVSQMEASWKTRAHPGCW